MGAACAGRNVERSFAPFPVGVIEIEPPDGRAIREGQHDRARRALNAYDAMRDLAPRQVCDETLSRPTSASAVDDEHAGRRNALADGLLAVASAEKLVLVASFAFEV